ncbi:hypothetical protein [Bremerella sp.]|uniref:hypothetical protein n=1 Tax=Bremerella sp. TaxID=2795602 RepID=UPI00391A559F
MFSPTLQVKTGEPVELVARVLPESSTPLADHFGEILVNQELVQITNPLGGIFAGGKHYIYGSHNTEWDRWEEDPLIPPITVVGAYQTDQTITLLDSLLVADGVTDRTWGSAYSAAVLPDGSLVFVGESEGRWDPSDPSQYFFEPTYWYDATQPMTVELANSTSGQGRINDISDNGTIVGNEFEGLNSPYFGSIGNTLWERVPATNGIERTFGLGIYDVSRDGQFAIDADNATSETLAILQANDTLGFDYFDRTHFTPIDVSSGLMFILSVETDDAGNAYFAGQGYADDGTIHVGFWDQNGNLVGDYTVGNLFDLDSQFAGFMDFAVVDGEVIAAVNISGDSMLVRMSDGDSVLVSELVGAPVYFDGLLGGLFADEGKLGMLLMTVADANDTDTHGQQGEFELFTTVIATTGFNQTEYAFHFDYDGDGTTDEIVTANGSASANISFDLPGIYMPTVEIFDGNQNLVGTESFELAVSPQWFVDMQLVHDNQTKVPGTISTATSVSPEFTEWDAVAAEIWVTLNADVPTEGFDLHLSLHASADWLTDPTWLSTLGELATIVEVAGEVPYLSITIENIDLSAYQEGNRVLVGTMIFPVTTDDVVGMPVGDGGAYIEPSNQDGFQLYRAKIGDGNQDLDREREIAASFLPMLYDSNDDGKVGIADFASFIALYGDLVDSEHPETYLFDYNQDGRIGLADFVLLINYYGDKKATAPQPSQAARSISTPTQHVLETEPIPSAIRVQNTEDKPPSMSASPLTIVIDAALAEAEDDSTDSHVSTPSKPSTNAYRIVPNASRFHAQAIDAILQQQAETDLDFGDWDAEDQPEAPDALLLAEEDLL